MITASGDIIGHDSALVVQGVKQMPGIIDRAVRLPDPAQLAHGDVLAAEMIAALAGAYRRLAANDGSDDRGNGLRNNMFDSAAGYLDGFVGA